MSSVKMATIPGETMAKSNLKALRKKLDLTQDAAARAIGVTTRTWVRWELGEIETPEDQQRLIDALTGPACHQAASVNKLIEHVKSCAKCRLAVTAALRS